MIRIFLLLLLIWSCGETPKKGNSISKYIDNVLYGNPVRIEISNNDKISLKISSDTLYRYNGGNTILFGRVYADLFDKNGIKTSELHSDSAIVYMNSDSVKAYGDVVIESIKGFKLLSDELILFNNTKLVKSEKDVVFTTDSLDTLYGIGFWSNFDMTKSQILKPKGTLSKIK
jgi:LPS export ABC transporter protein LptC